MASSRLAQFTLFLLVILYSCLLVAWQPNASPSFSAQSNGAPQGTPAPAAATVTAANTLVHEFPVLLQQNVVAGKTPAGTRIQAKLAEATLVGGKVVPRNAIFSGEVVESLAKTAADPARLSLRMDTVQWKDGSIFLTTYLTAWYYPSADVATNPDLQYGPQQSSKSSWNGMGQYPNPNSASYKPFPTEDSDKSPSSAVPSATMSAVSHHRVLMKDVESARAENGAITLIAKRTNLKLDKLTTYVLISADSQPAN
jgi:hypothetical protein